MNEERYDYTDPIKPESRWNRKTLLAILLPAGLAAGLGIQAAMTKPPAPPPVASRHSGSAERLQASRWVSSGAGNIMIGSGAYSTGAANNVAIGANAVSEKNGPWPGGYEDWEFYGRKR